MLRDLTLYLQVGSNDIALFFQLHCTNSNICAIQCIILNLTLTITFVNYPCYMFSARSTFYELPTDCRCFIIRGPIRYRG